MYVVVFVVVVVKENRNKTKYLLLLNLSLTQALSYFQYLILLSGHPSQNWTSLSLHNLFTLLYFD